MKPTHATTFAAVLGMTALGLTSCSAEVSTDDLATEVQNTLAAEVGEEPDEVDCPDPLPAEEDSEVECTLTHMDETFGVTVTSLGETDDEIEFEIAVDETPQ